MASPARDLGPAGLVAVSLATLLVLAGSLLSGFRLGFASDTATLLSANGPRVLLGAGAGALLGLASSMRLAAGRERPLFELQILAAASGASAAIVWLVARGLEPAWAVPLGASIGGALAFAAVGSLDRPRRVTNLGVALALLLAVTGLVYAGLDSLRERSAFAGGVLHWLFGGPTLASPAAGLAVLAVAGVLLAWTWRGGPDTTLSPLALGVAVGAAGPLAFAGAFAARSTRALTARASAGVRAATGAAAGAATVVAVDSLRRLAMGGYEVGFNLAAALIAVPVFLVWNRRRLRRACGRAHLAFEITEWLVIALETGLALAFASILTLAVRQAT